MMFLFCVVDERNIVSFGPIHYELSHGFVPVPTPLIEQPLKLVGKRAGGLEVRRMMAHEWLWFAGECGSPRNDQLSSLRRCENQLAII
jgi:hypothetical protein